MDTHTDALTAVNENLANTEDSFDEIKRAAMNGDAEAQFRLGNLYYMHAWYDEVSTEAVKWLERAAEQGHVWAQMTLGHGSTKDLDRDFAPLRDAPEEAIKWLRRAAEQGDSDAISYLIQIYEYGLAGAQKDPDEAAKWQLLYDSKRGVDDEVDSIRLKAESGDLSSQIKLAHWFVHGHASIERSDVEAVRLYSLAAEHPSEDKFRFSDKEIEVFDRLKDRCGAQLQRCIGDSYGRGRWTDRISNVEQSDDKAVHWYKLAAEKGDAIAQHKLALTYHNGQGIQQSVEEAVKWHELAAKQGHCEAQYELALMYSNGQGVSQSDELAAKWYERAAGQGHGGAQNKLGTMYDSGRGVKQNYRTAIRWFRSAAKQGEMIAQFNMGLMYLFGQGVKANDQKAKRLFRQSSKSGYVRATLAVASITGKVDDLARAVEEQFKAHSAEEFGKLEDFTLPLDDFDARLKSKIENSRVPRGHDVWEEVWDGNYDNRQFVKVLKVLDDSVVKQMQVIAEKLSHAGLSLIESRDQIYFRLSAESNIIFLDESQFRYSYGAADAAKNKDCWFRLCLEPKDTPLGCVTGIDYKFAITRSTMRIIENIETGDDPEALCSDVQKTIRDQIDAHTKPLGLRKFVRFKGKEYEILIGMVLGKDGSRT